MKTINCMVYFPQEFKKATQDTFHLTLGVRYHRDRWGEAAPDPADVEAPTASAVSKRTGSSCYGSKFILLRK